MTSKDKDHSSNPDAPPPGEKIRQRARERVEKRKRKIDPDSKRQAEAAGAAGTESPEDLEKIRAATYSAMCGFVRMSFEWYARRVLVFMDAQGCFTPVELSKMRDQVYPTDVEIEGTANAAVVVAEKYGKLWVRFAPEFLLAGSLFGWLASRRKIMGDIAQEAEKRRTGEHDSGPQPGA